MLHHKLDINYDYSEKGEIDLSIIHRLSKGAGSRS